MSYKTTLRRLLDAFRAPAPSEHRAAFDWRTGACTYCDAHHISDAPASLNKRR